MSAAFSAKQTYRDLFGPVGSVTALIAPLEARNRTHVTSAGWGSVAIGQSFSATPGEGRGPW